MCELPPWLVILTAWSRIRRANSVVFMACLHSDEADIGIPRKTLNLDIIYTERVEQRLCFAWPNEDSVLRVAGHRVLPPELRNAAIHRLELPQGRFERRIALPAGRYSVRRLAENGCLVLRLGKMR